MKKFHLLIFSLFSCSLINAQNVGIGTTTPNVNAALEIKANNKGVLMPRTSSISKQAMSNVPKGMMVYDSTYAAFYYHDGNKWRPFSAQNTDSIVKDYLSTTEVTANMPDYFSNTTTTANSGLLYDNGGPSGNYSNSALDGYAILSNDSTVGYKIIIEQLSLDAYDSLIVINANDQQHAVPITSTGSFTLPAGRGIVFIFRSNSSGNQAGFRIRWARIIAVKDPSAPVPAFGWHFDPVKLAARGGVSFNNNWIADSLGRYSFAYGNNATARGMNAFGFGENARAAGDFSLAYGFISQSTGFAAIAMGQDVQATGDNSFAAGWKAAATNYSSVAIGEGAKSTGDNSVAIGVGTEANNDLTLAAGSYCTATAQPATSIGYFSLASSNYTTAVGVYAEATGMYTSAFGNRAVASNQNATAVGDSVTAGAQFSAAFGQKARTTGIRTTAMGNNVTARSFGSTALGYFNNPINTSSTNSWVLTDPLLMVGNGTSSTTTSNALMILKNGNTGFGTNTPATKLHIDGGTDASFSSNSGYLVLGDVAGTNVVFDNNEIMARNNGVATTLFLQNSGGAFEVGGSAAKPGGGTWSATSDARLKQDVKPYDDGLQKLMQIAPVYYHYNDKSGYDTAQQHIGVIAQDLQQVAPYMVNAFKKDGTDYLKVDNSAMTYMLINAIKEQQEMINKQQQQIDELKKLVEQNKQR